MSKKNMNDNYNRIIYELNNKNKYSKRALLSKICREIITTFRDTGIKRTIFKIYCRIYPQKIFDKCEKFINDRNEIDYKYTTNIEGKKIVIYTAIFGGYDEIQEPLYVNPLMDYYIFTDREVPKNSIWKKINIEKYLDISDMDSYHISKYIKLFPNIFFESYDFSIWVDGTTKIWADLYAYIDRLNGNVIGMFDNPVHDCIYTEANFLIYYNRVPYELIRRQIADYRKEGYPEHNGMYECTIIVREHNDLKCRKLMLEWWQQINRYSMRDQISFPYVLWKNGISRSEVTVLGENRNYNPRISFAKHRKTQIYKK